MSDPPQVYRKIKKRQKERVGDGEGGDDEERAEVAARKRAEERMSLRHKVRLLLKTCANRLNQCFFTA